MSNPVALALSAAMLLGPAVSQTQPPAKPVAGSTVDVTVTYTGKTKVDDTHEIWVFLFAGPEMPPPNPPVGVQAIRKSGGVASFKNVTTDPVYVAVAFDEKGDYDGNSGPPPIGAPITMHSTDGKQMAAVTPGPKGKVKITFDETRRMQ